MRRRAARDLFLAGVLASGCISFVGCTFLIGFDEVPDAGSSGTDGSIPAVDGRVGDSGGGDTSSSDTGIRLDASTNPDACTGHLDGKYCGGDQIVWPSKDDLVTCKASKVSLVRNCATGQGCVGMLDGYPDECDECAEKPDGTYCGRDFTFWDSTNAQQRIRCQAGRIVGSLLCAVCKSNGDASACQ